MWQTLPLAVAMVRMVRGPVGEAFSELVLIKNALLSLSPSYVRELGVVMGSMVTKPLLPRRNRVNTVRLFGPVASGPGSSLSRPLGDACLN